MRRWIQYFIGLFGHYSGIDAVIRHFRGGRLAILTFHRIRDPKVEVFQLSISQNTVEWIIELLNARKSIVSLTRGLSILQFNRRSTNYVLTFDDGYADNINLIRDGCALAPAVIYLATGLIGKRTIWVYRLIDSVLETASQKLDLTDFGLGLWPLSSLEQKRRALLAINAQLKRLPPSELERIVSKIQSRLQVGENSIRQTMMTWDAVARLHASGIEIGGHTVDHTILSNLEEQEARNQIISCANDIRRRLGTVQLHFAYPNGGLEDFDDRHTHAVRESGFLSAVTTIEGLNKPGSDRFRLCRISVSEIFCRNPMGRLSVAQFLSGTSGLLGILREWIKG